MVYKPPEITSIQCVMDPPGDKSVSHRGILMAAIASGRSCLRRLPRSGDINRTLSSVRALGIRTTRNGNDVTITPRRGGQLREPENVINCGGSGTTMRLLTGLLSSGGFTSILTGNSSLRKRPMNRIIAPLKMMGAEILGRTDDSNPPLVVRGRDLKSIDYDMPIPSAQVKSSLLLAGLRGGVEVRIGEKVKSRDHLEIMLEAQGMSIKREDQMIRFLPGGTPMPVDMKIPGDPSSAAFFIVLALLMPDARVHVRDVMLNPTRTGFLDVLVRMGANIEVRRRGKWNGEEVGDIIAFSSDLSSTLVNKRYMPSIIDEVPVLAVAAARAEGETEFSDLEELRVKESDRIAAISRNLRSVGVEVEEKPDGFSIRGTRNLLSGKVNAFGDHRIAMAFSIFGASPGVDLLVDGEQSINKSFPNFFDHLEAIAGGSGEVGS